MSDFNPIYYAPELVQRNPYLRDSLLLGEGGKRTISKVTPSFVHNTVDNPIFPNSGTRLTGSIDFAGLGGNTNFIKPRVRIRAASSRSTAACRSASARRSSTSGRTASTHVPADHRDAVPRRRVHASAASTSARSVRATRKPASCSAATRRMLFNAEYLINIAGPVRLVLFYDTGQVRNIGQQLRAGRKTSTSASIRACR